MLAACDEIGFDSCFCVEHHFTGWGQISATLNLLTWLAARTRTLRVGTAVMVLPWHNPVLLAEKISNADRVVSCTAYNKTYIESLTSPAVASSARMM